ncbi:MAG: lipocalin-like domain-containing protein [Silvibacterium sp.]|nr:lipocalin-like domain-containing protein [Silvibacterium sp.]
MNSAECAGMGTEREPTQAKIGLDWGTLKTASRDQGTGIRAIEGDCFPPFAQTAGAQDGAPAYSGYPTQARTGLDWGILRVVVVVVVVVFWGLGAAVGVEQAPTQDTNRFVGAWRLAWLEQPGADGKLQRIECCGMFVFTQDGHASVQVMEQQPQEQGAAGPQQYSQGGYEASFGTYTVDESAHTFTFHVEGALVRSLIGSDLPRAYEFSGKQLIVKSTRADEKWRVCWEQY